MASKKWPLITKSRPPSLQTGGGSGGPAAAATGEPAVVEGGHVAHSVGHAAEDDDENPCKKANHTIIFLLMGSFQLKEGSFSPNR